MSWWDSLTTAASDNPLGAGALGLGIFDTLGGAFSQWQNAQRQRALYQAAMDPNRINSFYQPLSDQAMTGINRGLNANMASRGILDGGAGNQFAADAYAQIQPQLQQNAASNYYRALQSAGGNVGQPQGGGSLGPILQQLMMMQAMRQQQPQQQQQPNPYGDPYGGQYRPFGGQTFGSPSDQGYQQPMIPQLPMGVE